MPTIHDPPDGIRDSPMTPGQTLGMLRFSAVDSFLTYAPVFLGGVRVGSLNRPTGTNFLTGAGPTGGPQVKTFDGVSLAVLDSFYAYLASFQGGVFVAGN